MAPLLFFSLSVGQQPRYVLPVIIPLALLLAKSVKQNLELATYKKSSLFVIATALVGGLFISLGVIVSNTAPLFFDWSSNVITISAALISAAGIIICITSFKPGWTIGSIAIAVSVTTVVIHTFLLSAPNLSAVEKMAALLQEHDNKSGRYGRHAVFNRNLIFYTERQYLELPVLKAASDLLSESEPILCVLRDDDARLLEEQGIAFSRLGQVSSLNVGGLNLRTLLNPSADDVDQIVLVTNQE